MAKKLIKYHCGTYQAGKEAQEDKVRLLKFWTVVEILVNESAEMSEDQFVTLQGMVEQEILSSGAIPRNQSIGVLQVVTYINSCK